MSKRPVDFNEKTIDAIFRNLDQCHLPGAAVGIAIGGIPVYRKGFGLASLDLPLTLTPQTRMRIYSITKHFTCLAYLLLCEDGRAEIDDPVGKYLPELHEVTRRATMRQLMSNTSGIRDACEIRWFFSGTERTVPAREILELYRSIADANFPAGHSWCYNNGGFHVLSAVIERIADEPLEEVFRKRIFCPLGMYDTLLRRSDGEFVANSASMHASSAGGAYERKYLAGELLGEGGIVSTIDDMLRWLKHMRAPVIGSSSTWSLMTTPQRLTNAVATGYALGLFRYPYEHLDRISHSGGGFGANSQMIRVPEADLDVVILANRGDIRSADFTGQILNSCLDIGTKSARPDAEHVTGLFHSPSTGRFLQLYVKDHRQIVVVDGAEEWQLVACDDTALRPEPRYCWDMALKWRGPCSRPDSIQFNFFGHADELYPLQAADERALESPTGEYRSETARAAINVITDANETRAITSGPFGSMTYRLEALATRVWRMSSTDSTPWGGILELQPGGAGLTVSTSRNRKIRFGRSA